MVGIVNRALPERDLDEFMHTLASNIADYDHYALTKAKALIDGSTLPSDADLVTDHQAFFSSNARFGCLRGPLFSGLAPGSPFASSGGSRTRTFVGRASPLDKVYRVILATTAGRCEAVIRRLKEQTPQA